MLLFFENCDLDHFSSMATWVQLETVDSVKYSSPPRNVTHTHKVEIFHVKPFSEEF